MLGHFDEDLWTAKLGPARGSGVAAFRRGTWIILQYNLTLTIPNERFGEVREAVSAVVMRGDPGPLAPLAWLTGAWVHDEDGARSEQVWSTPAGGSMTSMSRSMKGGTTPLFEWRRIEARPSGIVLVISPKGLIETELSISSLPHEGEERAIFDGPVRDAPKRIIYERSGDELTVRVEVGGSDSSTTYRRAVLPAK